MAKVRRRDPETGRISLHDPAPEAPPAGLWDRGAGSGRLEAGDGDHASLEALRGAGGFVRVHVAQTGMEVTGVVNRITDRKTGRLSVFVLPDRARMTGMAGFEVEAVPFGTGGAHDDQWSVPP